LVAANHKTERLVPGLLVDTMWHTHMLDSRKYMADCDAVFGTYLHHWPYMDTSETQSSRDERYRKTLALMEVETGYRPDSIMAQDTAATCDCNCIVASSEADIGRVRPDRAMVLAAVNTGAAQTGVPAIGPLSA
jgi:hypothetical protein